MSDEAHFHLNGMVNQQNYGYWTSENSKLMHQRPLLSPKVWCAVTGLCFFVDEGIHWILPIWVKTTYSYPSTSVSVEWGNSPHIKKVNSSYSSWFSWLRHFPIKLIGTSVSRPVDVRLFFVGYLKSRVFEHQPRTFEELREANRVQVVQIYRFYFPDILLHF